MIPSLLVALAFPIFISSPRISPKQTARRRAGWRGSAVNKINSYQIYGLPRNVAERARRVAPRYFAPRCRRDRRRRPRVLTGRADTWVDVVSLPGYLCLELVFPPELHTLGAEMVEGKKRVRAGAITVREGRGGTSIQDLRKRFARESSVKTKRVSRRLSRLSHSISPSFNPLPSLLPLRPRSTNARAIGIFESDIAKTYATCDRVAFDTFRKRVPLFSLCAGYSYLDVRAIGQNSHSRLRGKTFIRAKWCKRLNSKRDNNVNVKNEKEGERNGVIAKLK